MVKQKPIRNSELEKQALEAKNRPAPDTLFGGIPRERVPLIVLFFAVTIGSFLVWSVFGRSPMLDEYTYEVVAEYPHDVRSFTQGLIFRDGFLYESVGRYEQSKIRKIDLATGEVIREVPLDDRYFGEGLCAIGDRLIQLTWKENTGFVYDLDLNRLEEFRFEFDGWGLTWDGRQLILSDGTSLLRFLNPETYEVENRVFVRKGANRMAEINELEYINGLVYANVLGDDMIYQISPVDGKVVGRINFQNLFPRNQRQDRESVMNGIAIRPDNGNLLVTGKNWSKVFEVKLIPVNR